MAWFRTSGNNGGSLKVRTASGAIASFETNMADVLQEVKCEINATGGNGTPDNPNPINGYSSANITRCGVNIFDEETELGQLNSDGSVSPSASRLVTKNYISVKGGTTYAFTLNTSLGKGRAVWYDANKQVIEYIADFPDTPILENRYALVTAPANAYYFKWCFTTAYGTTYRHDTAILYPSTQTNYVAYNGQTYTVNFGQTVYGGVLDVTRGKLRVTHNIINLGDYPWRTEDGIIAGQARIVEGYVVLLGAVYNQVPICSGFTGVSPKAYNQINYNEICFSNSADTPFIRARTSLFEGKTEDEIRQLVNGIQFVYELATPFDIDLTPVQIEALLGVNNVWHDGNGDTEVKYLEVVRN